MRTSEQIDQLATALAEAQGEFTNPERNRDVEVTMKSGGKYTFAYATFDAIVEMVRPVLSKHGLAILQPATTHDGIVTVAMRLLHKSGQWVEEDLNIATASADPQQLGSLITYMRRYSLCSMLGIASEEDDDGNAAAGNTVASKKDKAPMPACPKCGKTASVIESKPEFGGGWFCFPKKDGCGHKWHPESDLPEFTPENGKAAKPAKKAEPAKELPTDPYARAAQCIDEAADLAVLGKLVERCIVHESLDAAQKQTLLDKAARKAAGIKENHDGERVGVLHRIAEGTETVNV